MFETVSTTLSFVLAMVQYPNVQRKAREELDRVIGKDNLPTIENREHLPYINAICNESLRLELVTPMLLPHCTTAADIYNGYYIPANATVYANAWAMVRDPKEFPDAEVFRPERWLVEKPPVHSNKIAFGFGRRICPGRFLAENSIFLAVASILAAFEIGQPIGKDGKPYAPSGSYCAGFVRQPDPFECTFTPRSQKIASLIRQSVEEQRGI